MTPFVLLSLGLASFQAEPSRAEIVDVRRVWDGANHNAFTDLVRFRDRWFLTFREGTGHVSPDGAIRVLTSTNGEAWTSAARIASEPGDLRDPKLSITPDGRLMLAAALTQRPPATHKHQSFAWFSRDGRDWSEPHPIGDPNVWIWRPAWHEGTAYAVGYATDGSHSTRLYTSKDGATFAPLVPTLFDQGQPNESALAWLPDGTALCLLRRDGRPNTDQLGRSRPPYTEWTWKDLGVHLGGPALLRLPDGRIVAGGRLLAPRVHTALCWLDPDADTLTEFLALPSGGDTSYPGLALHEGTLWVSYYASHEGKTAIYLARVRLPEKAPTRP
ncbi:sialidase family protein [Paludisphaera mucosa]|uniref:Sialidase family protein n=1 Tax=Paludisphaera mucosa TaxID=3030827 RepID=A0ABT6F9K1_9BACT|nr:sialidase family protein [Paludisphaera mucosa]MDG3004235.1 sialidase family protein [Paludisphaera mucosa]